MIYKEKQKPAVQVLSSLRVLALGTVIFLPCKADAEAVNKMQTTLAPTVDRVLLS